MTRYTSPRRVVIVGASLAGLTTAEALRANGYEGDILLIGAEPELPYARPPLSKQVLIGAWSPEQAALRTAAEIDALNIQVRTGVRVTDLDVAAHELGVGSERIGYDMLVVATGVEATAAIDAPRGWVHSLRTLADARNLRDALEHANRVVVAGTGVLGSEIASAARQLGLEAVLIGRSRRLSLGAVGTLLSDRLVELHQDNGVELRLGSPAHALDRTAPSRRVLLADGTAVDGDVVVAAVGGTPQTRWLDGSGLTIADGVICDEFGLAAPGVYAVGDVARWTDPVTGTTRRLEHQANAIDQALSIAQTIVTGVPTIQGPPFFWSEIHGVRIQVYGVFDQTVPLVPLQSDGTHRIVLAAPTKHGITGIVGWNAARLFRSARALVDHTTRALAHSPPLSLKPHTA